MLFIESFLLIKLFGLKLFTIYVKTMVIFAIISLLFWLISLVSMSSLFNTLKIIDISGGFRERTGDYVHTIFITLHNTANSWTYGISRNSGFCWEPGPFSILLNLALFFNITYYKSNIFSKVNLILMITIITTFSTTGLLTLLGWLTYFLVYRKNIKYQVLLIILVSLFGISYTKYDFLGKKVNTYLEQSAHVVSRENKEYLSGSRLVGFPLVIQDVVNNPIFGKGLLSTSRYDYYGQIDSSFLNSLFTIASSMGLFGILWYLYFTIKSSLYLAEIFQSGMKYGFSFIILISSFGFNIHVWSIVFCFILFGYYEEGFLRSKHVSKINSYKR